MNVAIGESDAPIPDQLSVDNVEVTVVPGGVRIDCAVAIGSSATHVQLYHSTTTTLNPASNKSGGRVAVDAGRPITLYAGDITRRNLLTDGTFDSASGWTMDPGWSVTVGRAQHVSGDAGRIGRMMSLATATTYRLSWSMLSGGGFHVSNRARAELTGGLSTAAGPWRSASGRYTERLIASGSPNALAIYAESSFAGSVDDISIYAETAGCLPVGTNYFWIEPINADGQPGPMIGPFSATIE
ncbi:MAG: hypothetical protein Q4G26_07305 [Paracoccus sp. (in: a-proteobacteria)]|nr:hypothetical protein [Paracoccus sp. (in: a-proteobacteria)]